MDNFTVHHHPAIRTAIEACGAHLYYLPPYSPEFNPIENAFAKLKAFRRKAAARTFAALTRPIHDAIPTFTPPERAKFFTATGYEPEVSVVATAGRVLVDGAE